MARPQVWIVSPAWRRYSVTRLALAQRAHLARVLAGRGLDAHSLIVADDENLDIARDYGAHTIEAPNQVGLKFNVALQHAGAEGADWIVWIGSDDWVHEDLIAPVLDHYGEAPHRTRPIITGRRIAFVDLRHGLMQSCVARGATGVIPWIIPRQLLEPCGFKPLKPSQMRGLDGGLVRGMRRFRVKPTWEFHDPHPLARVDFKSDVNLNSYELIAKRLGTGETADPWTPLAERYPADLVDLARRTHLDLQGT